MPVFRIRPDDRAAPGAAAAHGKLGERNGIPNASGLSGLGGNRQPRANLLVCLFHPKRQIDESPMTVNSRRFAAPTSPESRLP